MKKYIIHIILISIGLTSCKSVPENYKDTIRTTNYEGTEIEKPVGSELKLKFCNQKGTLLQNVYMTSLHAHHNVDFKLKSDCLFIKINGNKTTVAGIYRLEALYDKELITLAKIKLIPEKVYGKIKSYSGPKSLSYDDTDGSMITLFPVDKYNNSTGLNDELEYTIQNGENETYIRQTLENTYPSLIVHKSTSPTIKVGAKSIDGGTIEHSLRALSGCPDNIQLKVKKYFPYADGRQFFKVNTNTLTDPDGNIVENGTAVQISLMDKNKTQVANYNATVINGIASCWIKNPIYDGTYTIDAKICQSQSQTIQIKFKSIIENIKYAWHPEKQKIRIGPLLNTSGKLIANGTPITMTFPIDNKEQELKQLTENGFAIIDLKELWTTDIPKKAVLQIFGKKYTVKQMRI